MPRNIEIKTRVSDLQRVKSLAAALANPGSGSDNNGGTIISQRDVFFNVPNGRLKLRFFPHAKDLKGELICYNRSDEDGPKLSDYQITKIYNDPEDLRRTLALALGVKGEVIKTRHLYMIGQTRVHCDQVENLGDFAELEVVLEDDQSVEYGTKIAKELMTKLEIDDEKNLISGAYMDLILKAKQ